MYIFWAYSPLFGTFSELRDACGEQKDTACVQVVSLLELWPCRRNTDAEISIAWAGAGGNSGKEGKRGEEQEKHVRRMKRGVKTKG